jgi:hypothetical protein
MYTVNQSFQTIKYHKMGIFRPCKIYSFRILSDWYKLNKHEFQAEIGVQFFQAEMVVHFRLLKSTVCLYHDRLAAGITH